MEQLPSIYWLPKLHKTPYGSRFIAASSTCSTKPLSGLLTTCLSHIMTHFKEYCNGIYTNTGINCFWIINNLQQVLQSLQLLNVTSEAVGFESFDFSTLYTSIPHDSLKSTLEKLGDEVFRTRGALYLCVNGKNKCFWSSKQDHKRNISKQQLVDMIVYLVDNIYVQVGNGVFCQCIGIPMGTNCAPLLENLYLFYHEYTFMKELIKTNMSKAKYFSSTFRYIDDLLSINNPYFESEIGNIYPPELVLKKTGVRVLMKLCTWIYA